MGSDGVFDNLFLDEIVDICNQYIPPARPGPFVPLAPSILGDIAVKVIETAHAKTRPSSQGHLPETPIGRGGKMDDTSVVVGEVVEWTEAHGEVWSNVRRKRQWANLTSLGHCRACGLGDDID